VKDSFGTLDLSDMGFKPVMSAQWIAGAAPQATAVLHRITAGSLDAWRNGWSDTPKGKDNFTSDFLAHPEIKMLANTDFSAGVVLNTSDTGITGISNLFGSEHTVLTGLANLAPNETLVGYETDPAPFFAHGFEPLGPLTVWIKTS